MYLMAPALRVGHTASSALLPLVGVPSLLEFSWPALCALMDAKSHRIHSVPLLLRSLGHSPVTKIKTLHMSFIRMHYQPVFVFLKAKFNLGEIYLERGPRTQGDGSLYFIVKGILVKKFEDHSLRGHLCCDLQHATSSLGCTPATLSTKRGHGPFLDLGHMSANLFSPSSLDMPDVLGTAKPSARMPGRIQSRRIPRQVH